MSDQFSSLKSFQKETVPLIIKELEQFFDHEIEKAEKKDRVLVDAVNVLKEFTLRGGKRVGPLMVVLGYRLASRKRTNNTIIRAASAAETHHLYLLNLDDMADRDVLRHGGKTLEEYYRTEIFQKWDDSDHHGRSFSSIIGSLLNSFTFELLSTSGFPPERIVSATRVITDMLFADTVTGWQIQYYQNNEPVEEVSEAQFMKGLEFVTSRYKFVGPLLMGLNLALDEKDPPFLTYSKIFTQFGKHVGIAFQIYDDILGLFGDPKETGKAVGHDIREGKKTLLIQYAYHHGNENQKQVIKHALNRSLSDAELVDVLQVIKDTGSLSYSQDLAKQHVEEAVMVLDQLPHQSNERQILKELAQYMIQRKT